MKTKKILSILCIIYVLLVSYTISDAAVQSSGGTVATYPVASWLINTRNMEKIGGGFGLSETINGNLTSSSGSNNIDIHMEKNTEYGAMAILSASSYGNPNKINNGETTTGNKSGIVINLNKEWVSAGKQEPNSTYVNAATRYKDIYSNNGAYEKELGDAITETAGWHGGSIKWRDHSYTGLLRAYSGSIFSYYYDYYVGTGVYYGAYPTLSYASRCVVIVGEGI